MAMVPFAEYGAQAGKYVMQQAAMALANKVASEIQEHATFENMGKALKKLAPGKKNAPVRAAARKLIINSRGMAVNAPAAKSYAVRRTAPRFRSTAGRYIVSNREFVSEISGSTTFAVNQFTIQPGFGQTFPWLSQISNTHQKYRFTSMKFTYVPLIGTDQPGRLTLVYAVDPLDPTPISKQELFQYPTSNETSVWTGNDIVVQQQPQPLFTRASYVDNTDLKTYDFGQLFVGVSNTTLTSVIGELFVEYTIELITPKPSHCPASTLYITGTSLNVHRQFEGPDPNNTNYKVYFPGGTWYGAVDQAEDEDAIFFETTGTFIVSQTINAPSGTIGNVPAVTASTGTILHTSASKDSNGCDSVIVVSITKPYQTVTFTSPGTWEGITSFEYHVAIYTPDTTTITGKEA
jgi:hypothetical protein